MSKKTLPDGVCVFCGCLCPCGENEPGSPMVGKRVRVRGTNGPYVGSLAGRQRRHELPRELRAHETTGARAARHLTTQTTLTCCTLVAGRRSPNARHARTIRHFTRVTRATLSNIFLSTVWTLQLPILSHQKRQRQSRSIRRRAALYEHSANWRYMW